MTDLAMIHAAAARIAGHAVVTPMLESPGLNAIAGRRVLVKAECLQRTGSFKFRGAWNAVSAQPEASGYIAYSSGNHAQGVALAARLHHKPAVIVMPSDAPAVKIANTRGYGAEVVLYDRMGEDREAIGSAIAAKRGLTLIRPYDAPLVIAGQGTTGLEIVAQAGVAVADVITCCGGGGLSSGIALALEGTGLRVRPAEPAGYDDVTRSLEAGSVLRNTGSAPTLCDAIMTPQPGEITFPILSRLCGPGLVVTDDQACMAVAAAFTHLRIVLEPGGAVALAASLFGGDQIAGDTVICTASGGNVDVGVFQTILSRFGGT
jgi:threonine dehydratase